MTMYYFGLISVPIVLILAATVVIIYALRQKGDVSAGLTLNRLGFTLTAKQRSDESQPPIAVRPATIVPRPTVRGQGTIDAPSSSL